jgi:predicted RND superfamily exporter protein
MLKFIGNIIEKHPWLVIGFITFITLGFSIFLPSIEMRTQFSDFMPEDETVNANNRITDYFGKSQQTMFLLVNKNNEESTITPLAIKEQVYIEQQILKIKEVEESTSLNLLIDQICQLEFGKEIYNCTNSQIQIALDDIFKDDIPKKITVFDKDDPNEPIDYNRYPRLTKGKNIDEIDIKNCYINYDNETIEFSFEVYDLSSFKDNIKSPIPFSNVVEWYLSFDNLIKPVEDLDISYKLAVHIEPKHQLWEIGKGFFNNIKTLFENIRDRELFNEYKVECYLWIKLPNQTLYYPLPLETAKIDFKTGKNTIDVNISREEIGKFGISPRFGLLELPAKLSNFRAGTRYYQTYIGKLPWFRITANTNFIYDAIERVRNSRLLSDIATAILKNIANISWESYDEMISLIDESVSVPQRLSLKEIENLWINTDKVSYEEPSKKILFLRPFIFNDLQVTAKGFLSKDFELNSKPSASLIVLNLNTTGGYEGLLESTEEILDKLEDIDKKYPYVSAQATGDGVVSLQMNEITMDANTIIIPMIFVVIMIILFLSFRRISYVLLPMSALVISTIWLFGTMVILNIPFTTIAVALVPLIMGLGVDYSVHLSHNYRSELANGKTPSEAIKRAVFEVGTAMFLAMITTVIAFLSFLSASITPIRDFGLLLALGILYTFITAITYQAAVRYLIDRKRKEFKIRKKKTFKLDKLMGIFAQKILNHKKIILSIIFIITIIFAIGAVQIKTGFDFQSFIPEDNPAIDLVNKIQEQFPFASQNQEYILIEGNVASVATLRGISYTHENFQDDSYITKRSDGTLKTTSIYTIIDQAVKNNLSLIETFNLDQDTLIPNTNSGVKKLFDYLYESEEYGFTVRNNLHRTNRGTYNAALIRIYVSVDSEGRDATEVEKDLGILYKEIKQDMTDYGDTESIATGMFIITHKITTELTDSQILSTGISLILATIVLLIAYKKPTLGLITIIPVMIAIIWILGTMFFIGYTLNVLTITVTSLTIGIGIDYAIHATERFKLVADKTGEIKVAVCETISRTGGALLIAALTTALGFIVLIFAPIPPQVQFGVITAMTISYSFITSVLLLPLILERWAVWTKKRKGYIISPKPPEPEYFDELTSCEVDE